MANPPDASCPVTQSTVTCTSSSGGATQSTVGTGAGNTAIVTGLDAGNVYNCTVTVSSAAGPSPPSPPSADFTVCDVSVPVPG